MKNVARHARALLKAYCAMFPGELPRLEQALTQLAEANPDILLRSNMLGHITTSMAVVDLATRKVLLVEHGTYQDWLPPGGHFECDVSLWLSAAREVLEETGVTVSQFEWCGLCSAELPLDVDTHPIPANPKKGEGDHFHHDFTFLAAGSETASLVAQVAEVNGVAWVHVHTLRNSRLERVRRIGAKLEAIFGWA